MKSPLLITLFGPAGSGKGTVGKQIAEHFDCQHVDMGDLRREMARAHDLTLEELHERALHDRTYDDIQDARVRGLPDEYKRAFICSRTAWFLLPQSIKVLLTCRPEVAAERVAQRQGISADEALTMNTEREAQDGGRFKRYLGIRHYPPAQEEFDVVVDSSDMPPEMVLAELLEKIEKEIELRG